MDALSIATTLKSVDWQAWQAAWTIRLQARAGTTPRFIAGVIVPIVLLSFGLTLLSQEFSAPMPFITLVVGAAISALGLTIAGRRMQRVAQPDEDGALLGPAEYRFDAQGISVRKRHVTAHYQWSTFKDVTLTPEHLFVWIDAVAGLIVPVRDLPADMTAQAAAERIRAFAAMSALPVPPATSDAATPPLPTPAHSEPQPQTDFVSMRTFLGSMARFLALRSTPAPRLLLRDSAIFALAIAAFTLWVLLDWLRSEKPVEFYAYGLVPLAWHGALVLAVAWLWSRLSEPQVPLRFTLAVAITLQMVALVLLVPLQAYVSGVPQSGVGMILALYATLCGAAALRAVTVRQQPRAVFTGLLLLCGAVWFAGEQYVDARFWYPPAELAEPNVAENANEEWQKWQQTGELLFEQADRIDAEVARLVRPAEVTSAAFFLGFAGIGEQKVFAEEIALAQQIIANGFDSGDRSLRLVNDQRNLKAHPLASPPAFRHALMKIAARMDLERDVLFLALSSHGSEDGELSVSNGSIPVLNLSVKEVAEALRDAGIRRRVVIVSACYSGTFIEPLRDEHTIVITAAAADRTSFGCSDDRDLTYFGEAFYRDALSNNRDLRTAFEHAAAAIAEREKREGIEASNPQAHFGKEIEEHLRSLRRDPDVGG